MKEEWRCATGILGAQSVIMDGAVMMRTSFVVNLDTNHLVL